MHNRLKTLSHLNSTDLHRDKSWNVKLLKTHSKTQIVGKSVPSKEDKTTFHQWNNVSVCCVWRGRAAKVLAAATGGDWHTVSEKAERPGLQFAPGEPAPAPGRAAPGPLLRQRHHKNQAVSALLHSFKEDYIKWKVCVNHLFTVAFYCLWRL